MKRTARMAALAAVLIVAAAAAIAYANRPISVVAYGLPERARNAFAAELAAIGKAGGGRRISFRAKPDEGRGKAQWSRLLGGADIALIYQGPGIDEGLGGRIEPLPPALSGRVSPRIEGAGEGLALPLLVDELGVAFDASRFRAAGLEPPTSLAGIEAELPAVASRGGLPLLASGADDGELLALVSALVVAEEGEAGYRSAAARLASDGGLAAIDPALDRLATWAAKGILHPNWLDLKAEALAPMVRDGLAPGFIALLGDRRLYDPSALQRYPVGRFPEGKAGRDVPVVAPTVSAIVPKGAGDRAFEPLGRLSAPDALARVAAAAGLAPATSAAQAADLQARLARQDAIERGRVAGLATDAGIAPGALAARIREELGKRR